MNEKKLRCRMCKSIWDLMVANWCWVRTGGQVRHLEPPQYRCDRCESDAFPEEVPEEDPKDAPT